MYTRGKRERLPGEYKNNLQGFSREENQFSAIKVQKY
jgi:hypothetical protein